MRIVIRALSLAAQFVLLTVASAMIIWVLGAIVLGVWELITPVSYEAPVWVLATGLALGALNATAVLTGNQGLKWHL